MPVTPGSSTAKADTDTITISSFIGVRLGLLLWPESPLHLFVSEATRTGLSRAVSLLSVCCQWTGYSVSSPCAHKLGCFGASTLPMRSNQVHSVMAGGVPYLGRGREPLTHVMASIDRVCPLVVSTLG